MSDVNRRSHSELLIMNTERSPSSYAVRENDFDGGSSVQSEKKDIDYQPPAS